MFVYTELKESIIAGSYQWHLCLLTLFLLWLLVRFDNRRTIVHDSTSFMRKVGRDIFSLDEKSLTFFISLIQKMHIRKPHLVFSSVPTFDAYFKSIFRLVDKKKKYFVQKPYLLYLYGFLREKLTFIDSKDLKKNNRRRFFRYPSVESISFVTEKNHDVREGLLLNISCGGVRLFAKTALKKGEKINLCINGDPQNTLSAKILEVVKKADFNVVRAKFPFAYKNLI